MDIDEINPSRGWFFTKLGLIAVFIAGDVYLNSKAEYEALQLGPGNELEQLQMILFGCSLVLQLSIASSIFLIVSNTFPFQVGLWAEIQNRFKWLLIVQPVYMVLSCIVGGMRLNQVFNGNTDLWRWWYSTISALHKLVAPCYYAVNLRSALGLGRDLFYRKDFWSPAVAANPTSVDYPVP